MGNHFAVVDAGSNALRWQIAAVDHPKHYRIVAQDRQPVRLGGKVFQTGKLDPQAAEAALRVFKDFKSAADRYRVKAIRAVGTSALREASDRGKFISRAKSAGVPLVGFEDLLARADFLTLHLPALADTRHLLNAKTLALCKKGVRIVNTARGELIDEPALADAIQSGQVAGAALDVFETEPPADARLTVMPQVIATPHIAASTTEAQELVGVEVAMSVRDYLSEGLIRNAVNFPAIAPDDFRSCALT